VKRMKADTFNLQHRGTIGKSVGKLRVDDAMSDFLVCHAHDHVLFFRYVYLKISFVFATHMDINFLPCCNSLLILVVHSVTGV